MDASLQKELASLRGFIGGALTTHTERLHGDLAALLPEPRTPELDNPPIIVERSWSKIAGWTLAVIALAGAGFMSWMWWNRGSEIAALNTDLTAAYTELETLRARPVAAPAAVEVTPDPNAVIPAADAPDAAASATGAVELVPDGGVITPPAAATPAPATSGPVATAPATAAPTTAAANTATSAPAAAPATVPAAAAGKPATPAPSSP